MKYEVLLSKAKHPTSSGDVTLRYLLKRTEKSYPNSQYPNVFHW